MALVPGLPAHIDACLFDLDGVLTQTAKVHGFGWVVGVDRLGQAAALLAHGADRVVGDLSDLLDGQ
jgi:beta-phosphoglucomutase-like phosphatase (HAD superfamily)